MATIIYLLCLYCVGWMEFRNPFPPKKLPIVTFQIYLEMVTVAQRYEAQRVMASNSRGYFCPQLHPPIVFYFTSISTEALHTNLN